MPSMIIQFNEECDKKLRKLAVDRNTKNKKELVENILRDYLEAMSI